ncbi:MAG: cytochrome b [Rhodobacter sp.]|nr:cytochrome b [Paracoccaceae bacterium]MCC0076041.1 cytochrome b [Rhodobacter sp.]
MSGTVQKYAVSQRLLHWLTLLLLIVSFVSHEAMKTSWIALRRTGEATFSTGTAVHVWIGVAILVLTLLRIVLRFTQGAPAPVEGQNPMITLASAIVHGLLYIVLLLIPLSGIMAWFVGITDAGEVHEVLFNIGWVLVALHIVAALYHQFFLKDNLIARMR